MAGVNAAGGPDQAQGEAANGAAERGGDGE